MTIARQVLRFVAADDHSIMLTAVTTSPVAMGERGVAKSASGAALSAHAGPRSVLRACAAQLDCYFSPNAEPVHDAFEHGVA